MVRGQAALPVPLTTRGPCARGRDLLAGAEADAVLCQAAQGTSIAVTPVQGHEAARGPLPPTGTGAIAARALRNDAKGGEVTGVVREGAELHGPLSRAEPGPRQQAQAEREGGAVQGQAWSCDAQALAWRDRLPAGVECEHKGVVQRRRAPVVGRSPGGTLGWCPAEGRKRAGLGGHPVDHIPQAGAAGWLGEEEGAKRAPPAQDTAPSPAARLFVQRLDGRAGGHLEHVGKEGVPMSPGSHPPCGRRR